MNEHPLGLTAKAEAHLAGHEAVKARYRMDDFWYHAPASVFPHIHRQIHIGRVPDKQILKFILHDEDSQLSPEKVRTFSRHEMPQIQDHFTTISDLTTG